MTFPRNQMTFTLKFTNHKGKSRTMKFQGEKEANEWAENVREAGNTDVRVLQAK